MNFIMPILDEIAKVLNFRQQNPLPTLRYLLNPSPSVVQSKTSAEKPKIQRPASIPTNKVTGTGFSPIVDREPIRKLSGPFYGKVVNV